MAMPNAPGKLPGPCELHHIGLIAISIQFGFLPDFTRPAVPPETAAGLFWGAWVRHLDALLRDFVEGYALA